MDKDINDYKYGDLLDDIKLKSFKCTNKSVNLGRDAL